MLDLSWETELEWGSEFPECRLELKGLDPKLQLPVEHQLVEGYALYH